MVGKARDEANEADPGNGFVTHPSKIFMEEVIFLFFDRNIVLFVN